MRFSESEILSTARSNGFNEQVVEKVFYLVHLLNTLNSHPSLKGKWALKGGTALNLFVFRYPRLSVDIDLNYIGVLDREEMLMDRPLVEQAVQAVFSREGFDIRRVPREHAGGKWQLRYPSFTGQSANLDVDLNFMFRQPLVEECKYALSAILPFTDTERAFLDLLLDEGKIDATILTSDISLQERIQAQPLLEWKALNVRYHKELSQ